MTYKTAITSAKNLLQGAGILHPPVDVRNIAKSLSISIAEAPNKDDGMSGLILRSDGKTLIGVNASHHENRKRFTIAHELGHFKLHDKGVFVDHEKNFHVKFRSKHTGFDPEESEANAFAAELLMPEEWIKSDFETLKNSFSTLGIEGIIDVLTKKYEVSSEAMRIRLDCLSLG